MKKNNKKTFFLFRNSVIVGIFLVASAVTAFSIIKLNVLVTKYLLIAMTVLALLFLIVSMTVFKTEEGSKKNLFAKIVSLLLSLALLFGTFHVFGMDAFLSKVTGAKKDSYEMSVIVLKEKSYEKIEDVKDLEFGVNKLMDKENIEETFTYINKEKSFTPQAKEYTNYKALVEDLENGVVEVIVLNEGHRDIVLEYDKNFNDKTKVIHTVNFEKEVQLADLNTKVKEDTFSMFISGIDTYGPVSSVARSDVNLIMTVNPVDKQILLTSIPRDYHVPLATSGQLDKLTHSGIYGINESVQTLENLLDMDIDYYVRVNFTSVENIVDAMGGVEVESMYDFNAGGYSYNKGMNHMDGKMALRFVRERYTLPNGDMDRGRHQQALMTGIINKALSPSILMNYNSVLASVSDSLEMSMPESHLKDLVKMQQKDNASWDIQSYQLQGYGAKSTTTYSMPGWNLYVMEPDRDSVEYGSELIKQMENHEVIQVNQ
ncbi:LCP family protein [Erysipelothrix urinaevulpis]|uniref:LCP family protein n=1 Tax=Erysipelothrix urinaevulpis TaxID=2683717 RepID=UPI001358D36B|nr:LCP family protein [Erysipelothrix urinaevulpis]